MHSYSTSSHETLRKTEGKPMFYDKVSSKRNISGRKQNNGHRVLKNTTALLYHTRSPIKCQQKCPPQTFPTSPQESNVHIQYCGVHRNH